MTCNQLKSNPPQIRSAYSHPKQVLNDAKLTSKSTQNRTRMLHQMMRPMIPPQPIHLMHRTMIPIEPEIQHEDVREHVKREIRREVGKFGAVVGCETD